MSLRAGLCGLMACLSMATARAAAPADPKPPANDDCLLCHGDPSLKRDDGRSVVVDAAHFTASVHGPMACVDCHADLAKSELPHAPSLARVACATCHDDIGGKYHDSIHAWAKEKAGLTKVAPACAECHGTHDIKGHTDPASRVYRARIPATCGGCHAGVRDQYDHGIHGVALKSGNARAPVCIDCHTAHSIKRTDTSGSRLGVTAACVACHAPIVESYRRTFHGKVTELGDSRIAECADCHGAHDVLPASNPASTIAPAHLTATCGRCHRGASASFVQYDPHPNPHDYQRSATLWWANRFYWVLIPGCFGFFALHSALWFRRSWKDRASR
jgi:hypothetical protein